MFEVHLRAAGVNKLTVDAVQIKLQEGCMLFQDRLGNLIQVIPVECVKTVARFDNVGKQA